MPFRQRHQTRLDQLPVAEPGQDLLVLTPQPGAQLLVEQLLHRAGGGRVLRVLGPGHPEAGDGEVAAWRQRVAELGGDALGIFGVGDMVQDRQHEQPHRAAEIDEVPDLRVIEDRGRLADVRGDHPRRRGLLQHRRAVDGDHRVDIGVDHSRGGVDLMRDLVHVPAAGQP
jgi:hypothetical protein